MAARLGSLLPRLNERDRRLALGAEARAWGRGGIAAVHRASGVSRPTIRRGVRELEAGEEPESPLRWTTKSTRKLAAELTALGHTVSHSVVAQILWSVGYSLQGTRKTLEGTQHPDRDAQFRYLNALAGQYLAAGDPVISVDTKKKELVGRFARAGREWRPTGSAPE